MESVQPYNYEGNASQQGQRVAAISSRPSPVFRPFAVIYFSFASRLLARCYSPRSSISLGSRRKLSKGGETRPVGPAPSPARLSVCLSNERARTVASVATDSTA